MVYTCYDEIYTVLGIGRAPPGLPGEGHLGLVPGFTRTGPKGLLVGSTGKEKHQWDCLSWEVLVWCLETH
jgi:hypothetical protein